MITVSELSLLAYWNKKNILWLMGHEPYEIATWNRKRVYIPLSNAQYDSVLFLNSVICRVQLPIAKDDSPLNHAEPTDWDPYNGKYGLHDYIPIHAYTTVRQFIEIINTFYNQKITKDNPYYQTIEGQKMVGKTYAAASSEDMFKGLTYMEVYNGPDGKHIQTHPSGMHVVDFVTCR